MAEFKGIDVSKYQGVIDWNKVKASGQSFAFIRVGWCNYDGTITEGIDPYYKANMEGAIKAGLDVGVYVYSYAKTTAAAQVCANKVLELVKPYKLTMPIAWDYEDSKTYASLGKATNSAICKAFLDVIQKANYYAILYTYTSFINAYLDWNSLTAYDKWIADYRGYCGYTGVYSIWQYSSDGTVPGISGRCDMNIMYKDLPSLIRERGLNGFTSLGFENLSNYELKISESNGREYFNSASIYDVAGKLDAGKYKAIARSTSEFQGYSWCKFELGGKIFYTVLDTELSTLVKGEEIQLESVSGTLHILVNNKREYFRTADVYDIAGKMPAGDYRAVRKSTKTYKGFDWVTFKSEGVEYFTTLEENVSTLTIDPPVETPVEVPVIPPVAETPVETPKEDYVTKKYFEAYKTEISNALAGINKKLTAQEELKQTVKETKEVAEKFDASLKEVLGSVSAIQEWIKSFK